MSNNDMRDAAKSFGIHDLVLLDEISPRQLDYLDLIGCRNESNVKVDAVAEFQSRPVFYIVFGSQARDASGDIIDLQRLLANRGERAYLGFLRPGELEVRPLNLERKKLADIPPILITEKDQASPTFFQSVVNGSFSMSGFPDEPDFIFKSIFDLLTKSSQWLINLKLPPLDVLSCLGRALFFRFLKDRKIILEEELEEISPRIKRWGDCFADSKKTAAVSCWLDQTFNGDLLPFHSGNNNFFQSAPDDVFLNMQAVLLGWEHAENHRFQATLDWDDLNFAHIPVGVLSQVYERFSKTWDERLARETSVFYTPKNIARYLVEDAFASIPDKKNAKILDPCCGAGIFLVLAFRALVRAYWQQTGKRPDTEAIKNILYTQLRGFDISESALRLTALSLYITAIELNDSPRPPRSLKFPEPLKNTVLFNHRRPEEEKNTGFIMGSLRSDLEDKFKSSFDLVIGNPPWSKIKEDEKKNKAINAEFTKLTRNALVSRGLDKIGLSYKNPDNDPDLPFLWKASEWAKPGALIALALPARIFLKQSDSGRNAFKAILRGFEITGILNGSNLSDTDVWPGMSQPFMLFFAKNKLPSENSHFYFVSPQFEGALNSRGLLRVDYNAATPVAVNDVILNPWLLKSLAVGTTLDIELLTKTLNSCDKTIDKFWKDENLRSGKGYSISKDLTQYDASHLLELPVFERPAGAVFHVNISSLPKFKDMHNGRTTANRTRDEDLYKPPLLIIPKAPGGKLRSPRSFIFDKPIAFNVSHYGYSACNHKEGNLLTAFLHLVTHSILFPYYVLMTSPSFAAERRVFLKSDFASFPVPNLNKLTRHKELCLSLSRQLKAGKNKTWDLIDNLIGELYNLDKNDITVINDSLQTYLPFQENRNTACQEPSSKQKQAFYDCLEEMLSPAFDVTGEKLVIEPIEFKRGKSKFSCAWIFFSITASSDSRFSLSHDDEKYLLSQALETADKNGCSRMFVRSEKKLFVGILGQYRYWTVSRARLCGLHILRNYLDVFPVEKES